MAPFGDALFGAVRENVTTSPRPVCSRATWSTRATRPWARSSPPRGVSRSASRSSLPPAGSPPSPRSDERLADPQRRRVRRERRERRHSWPGGRRDGRGGQARDGRQESRQGGRQDRDAGARGDPPSALVARLGIPRRLGLRDLGPHLPGRVGAFDDGRIDPRARLLQPRGRRCVRHRRALLGGRVRPTGAVVRGVPAVGQAAEALLAPGALLAAGRPPRWEARPRYGVGFRPRRRVRPASQRARGHLPLAMHFGWAPPPRW